MGFVHAWNPELGVELENLPREPQPLPFDRLHARHLTLSLDYYGGT